MKQSTANGHNQAIQMLESGLSYYIPRTGRYRAEDALWCLRQGRTESAYEAIAEAACLSDGVAKHFLQEARNLIAPERFSSS